MKKTIEKMVKKNIFPLFFLLGLCLVLLGSCSHIPKVSSPEEAAQVLQENVLPQISIKDQLVTDTTAQSYSVKSVQDPLPSLDKYPIYGPPDSISTENVYLEIFGSPDKSNPQKEDERWLIDVVDQFNAKNLKTSSGKLIQVGVRNIPSGIAQRMIEAKVVKPTAYTPSNELWIALLKSAGVQMDMVTPKLLPNQPGFILNQQAKQEIFGSQAVSFDQLLDGIVAGKLSVGYTNPYSSSSGLNLLYTIFWRGAGHQQSGQTITTLDLQSPKVNSLFQAFQKQVLVTGLTTLELKDIAIRDPKKLSVFVSEALTFNALKKIPEFANSTFIPFGVPHNNPLVKFKWTTPEQQEGLELFAKFAQSDPMQNLAPRMPPEVAQYLAQKQVPPIPSGEVLSLGQTFWKTQKDAGKTVYLMTVIDTSGSMSGGPLEAVKNGLRVASQQINPGNYVGLVSYGDQPINLVKLAPFDNLQHKRFLAGIDGLEADGATAMYDGVMVGLSELLQQRKTNPNGKFYLLLLTDGQTNQGFNFEQVKEIIEYSGVRVYPIAYGEVNEAELNAIAALRESTVKKGTPENVQELLKGLFQVNL
ncbi:MAG: VWA domain-containing protein [Cylindrospermopsis raciborskii]|jgi:Ca-activated chloride channel family protein|uniref:VWA domain-containing protein n=1 Tax=Cylindrospermopsis raciborskii TaxID=77022 RepID=UPI003D14040B